MTVGGKGAQGIWECDGTVLYLNCGGGYMTVRFVKTHRTAL